MILPVCSSAGISHGKNILTKRKLPKVNVCPTSTVAVTTTRAFRNDGFVMAARIAAKETTNSLVPDAGKKNSGMIKDPFE